MDAGDPFLFIMKETCAINGLHARESFIWQVLAQGLEERMNAQGSLLRARHINDIACDEKQEVGHLLISHIDSAFACQALSLT